MRRCAYRILRSSAALVAVALMLGCRQADASGRNEYWHQRVSLFDKLPVESGDIVFLGNSITDGGEFHELFRRHDIKNRGISGDVVDGVRERLEQVMKGHPSKVFLLIGINDISHGKSAEAIAREYDALVREMLEKSPATRLYLQSVMPIDNDFRRYRNLTGREHVIPELNDLIKKIAESRGCTYIDLWPLMAEPATGKLKRQYTNDGLHLTGEAYRDWADFIVRYVGETAD